MPWEPLPYLTCSGDPAMGQVGGAYKDLAQLQAQENSVKRRHQEPALATSSSELGVSGLRPFI